MPRQNRTGGSKELLPGKIRKRGCSSSASSSSSTIQNYRLKRAIMVRKRGGSGMPVPTWRLTGSIRTPSSTLRVMESPRYAASSNCGGKSKQQPVSVRKLAATLWELNELPSPKVKEVVDDRRLRRTRERSANLSSLPPHLSDPSHSAVSERNDISGTGSHQKRSSLILQRLRPMDADDADIGVFDSISNHSLMEIERRSHAQTPTGSTVGVKTRLRDVNNALTTSKELLKIINHVWEAEDQPSSSFSVISALHSELERARLQVNHLIQEKRTDQSEINYLMKCFAEEKAAWKNKEQKMVETAIESIAGEVEVEKRLRRQFENLNKKLGKELAETKSSLLKAVKALEKEKRARTALEQLCDELVRDLGQDNAEVEELKRESAILCEEVEKEREMMHLADVLREERVHMKLSEAKYQLEEKNAIVDKLRSQLEAFLGTKRTKERGSGSFNCISDEEIASYLSKSHSTPKQDKIDVDDGEVKDGVECEEDLAEGELHSMELNMDNNNNNKSYEGAYLSGIDHESEKAAIDEEIKGRKSTSSKVPSGSISVTRSVADGTEWGTQNERLPIAGEGLDLCRYSQRERSVQINGYGGEIQEYQSAEGVKGYLIPGSRTDSPRDYASSRLQSGQLGALQNPGNAAQERPPLVPGNHSKSRLAEARGEKGLNARKSTGDETKIMQ